MENLEINRFSISSFNTFRTNRFQWYLRYVMGFKSAYEMFSAWRGLAIELGLQWCLWRRGGFTVDEVVMVAVRSYQNKVLDHLLGLYTVQVPGFDYKELGTMLRTLPIDEFPSKVQLIMEAHVRLDPAIKYEFLIPGHRDNTKYMEKLVKQYTLISETIPLLVDKFMEWRESESLKYQQRIKPSDPYGLKVPVLGYADWTGKNFGIDLKTVNAGKIPKDWNRVPLNTKCQMAFYSKNFELDWKVIYASRLSKDSIKNNFLIEQIKSGYSSKEIMAQYKDFAGSGTTDKYVEKVRDELSRDAIKTEIPYAEYMLPANEISKYEEINRFTCEAILRIVNASRSDHLREDLKYFCLGDLEHLYMKKDEAQAIEKEFGFVVEAIEDSDDSE